MRVIEIVPKRSFCLPCVYTLAHAHNIYVYIYIIYMYILLSIFLTFSSDRWFSFRFVIFLRFPFILMASLSELSNYSTVY